MTRFGMFFLAGGVALIFAMWGVLKWLDQPRPGPNPRKRRPLRPHLEQRLQHRPDALRDLAVPLGRGMNLVFLVE